MRDTAAGAAPRARIEEAARGLLHLSETESPLEYVELPGAPELTPEGVRAALGEPAGTPVAERFGALRRALQESLSGVKVFRVGEVRVRYYALGRTPEGRVAGVAAEALET